MLKVNVNKRDLSDLKLATALAEMAKTFDKIIIITCVWSVLGTNLPSDLTLDFR